MTQHRRSPVLKEKPYISTGSQLALLFTVERLRILIPILKQVRTWWAQKLHRQKKRGWGQPVLPSILPLFFCLDSEELFLGLCGLWQDAVHFQSAFPGANWERRAQPRAISCCMFPKLGTKGEDFLFSSEYTSHVTCLRMRCKWDFKTNFNQFPLHIFNQKKVFHCYQKWQKCPFASYAWDSKLSPIIQGSIRKSLTCQGRFLPRAHNIILHSSKPVQHWSRPVKYQMEDINLVL